MGLRTREQDKIETLIKVALKGLTQIVSETFKEPLKKSRLSKEPTPEKFSKVTKYTYMTMSLGHDYGDILDKQLKKLGINETYDVSETYCHCVSDNKLVYKHNEREQFYLRVYPGLCASFKTVIKYYDAQGTEILNWKDVEAEYFAQKSGSVKQLVAGIQKEITPNNIKMENVKYIKQGDFCLNDLTQDIIKKLGL